jgi:phenylacetate-CoA ligase
MTLYQQKSGVFYDSWEQASEDFRESHRYAALKEYLLYAAAGSDFYRERLQSVNWNATQPLKHVPVLTAETLRTLIVPESNQIVRGKGYTVFQSGGTTGKPKSTLFSSAELDALDFPNARGFFACGLTPEDRVGNLFAVGSLYMTFVHINRMLQQYGCENYPFSNHTPADFVHTVVQLFRVNCLTGIASVVLNALRSFPNADGIEINKIFFGGEHLYEADKREIELKFGTKTVLAPGYGTVDTWYIGYQCEKTGTGVFHAHDDQTYIEIVNEDTGEAAAINEPGMILATAFPRRVMPIVRYRVGDRAKWLPERCICGRTTPLFQLLGRGDDVLRIGYDSVDYNAVQAHVLKFSGLSGSIFMQKEREGGKDRLVIKIETEVPHSERIALAEQFADSFVSARPSLRDFVKKEMVWPVRVELVDPGSLPRNSRTGKLIRVADVGLS